MKMSEQGQNKKVHIRSYGCQMNVYDSSRMADVMAAKGYDETPDIAEADLVILNTCHIRERASEKIFSELGKIREMKQARHAKGRDLKIAVAGCVAQAEGVEIFRRESAVDIVVGPQSYHRLGAMIDESNHHKRVMDTEFPVEDKFQILELPQSQKNQTRGVSAFVTIQEGCDKFCSFCVVPFTRGMEVSRPVDNIMSEVKHLTEHGVREITLLGQNVNAYIGHNANGEKTNLAQLMLKIARIDTIKRIRYMTSHPLDMSDDLILAHKNERKIMPFIHLPVQSGSDRILQLMNRRHSADDYRRLIDKIRHVNEHIVFSSDFIVGFPDESDQDFEATLQLIRDVGFASAYSFSYSSRPGTKAAEMAEHLSEPLKLKRLHELQAILEQQRQAFNQSMVGKKLNVLFEKKGRHHGQIVGKSEYMQPVHIDGPEHLIGQECMVEITGKSTNSLFGCLVTHE
jgi:tRNA-2-methylthio-N6-dimethylallyladenosine synthase